MMLWVKEIMVLIEQKSRINYYMINIADILWVVIRFKVLIYCKSHCYENNAKCLY